MKTPADFWRNIPGTDGKYQASRAGEIRRVLPNGKTNMLRPYLLSSECHKHCRHRLHVHLRIDGKDKVWALLTVMAKTWKGPLPPGMVWHHKNGNLWDNSIDNIQPIKRSELGKKTGGRSNSRSVEMVDEAGNVVDLFPSARAAGRATHISYQAVLDRIHGRVANPYALNGCTFRYEDGPTPNRKKARK